MPTPTIQVLERALGLLQRLRLDEPVGSAQLIGDLDLPPSTAHRVMTTLRQHGFLLRVGRDRYFAGGSAAHALGIRLPPALLAEVAQPHLCALAKRTELIAQLGVLEDDMVTYLAKAGHRSRALFTREGMQLEAYCTGLGKILLAALSADRLEAYLANGPFVAITANTITDPAILREELVRVRERDYAEDREEIQLGLCCVAVPVRDPEGVLAALSVSGHRAAVRGFSENSLIEILRNTAASMQQQLFPKGALYARDVHSANGMELSNSYGSIIEAPKG
jgi:DNA-binding IclR family transcriptional regulator